MVSNTADRPAASRRVATLALSWSILAFSIGVSILPPALVKIQPEMGLTTAQLKWLSGAMFAPFVLMVAVGGYLARSVPKGAITMSGCCVMAVSCACMGIARSYGQLTAGAALLGLGGGFVEATGMVMIGELFEGHRRTAAMNYSQVAFAAGAIGVPLGMAALIKAGWTWRVGFWIAAAAFVASAAWLIASRTTRSGAPGAHLGETRRVLDPFTAVLALAMFCYVSAEVGLCFWLPTYFHSVLHAPAAFAAASNGVFWTGVIIGRLAAGYFGRIAGDLRLLRVSSMAGVAALALFLAFQSPIAGIITAGVAGLTFACIWPTILSYAGHVYGVRLTVFAPWIVGAGAVGATAGPFLLGTLAAYAGQRAAFVLNPALFVVLTIIFMMAPFMEPWARGKEEV